MAKCERCGKKGLFLKINSLGHCKECQAALDLENELAEIRAAHDKLYAKQTEQLEQLKAELSKEEDLFNKLKAQAVEAAQRELEPELQKKSEELIEVKARIAEAAAELEDKKKDVAKADKAYLNASNKAVKLKKFCKAIEYSLSEYYKNISFDEGTGFQLPKEIQALEETLHPTVTLPLHCLDVKDLRKQFRDNEKQIEELLLKYQDRYTTKANIAIYRLMVIALRAELQNVLRDIKEALIKSGAHIAQSDFSSGCTD